MKDKALKVQSLRRRSSQSLSTRLFEGIVGFLFVTLLLGLCFTVLYSVIKVLPVVFNDMNDLGNPNVIWVPDKMSVDSFKLAIKTVYGDGLVMIQTLLYCAVIAFIQMMLSAMVGYVIGRGGSRLYDVITALVVMAIMVPPQTLLISQYLQFKNFDFLGIISLLNGGNKLDLIGNPIVLYILALTGFGLRQNVFVFIFRQSFKSFPKELEESALIDGCNFYGTYFKIAFPNAVPSMVTVLTLSFVWNYGDKFYTTYFDPEGPYLANKLSSLFQYSNRDIIANYANKYFGITGNSSFIMDAVKYAAVLLYLLPLLLMYFFMQKKLVENFERSGIVG